MLKERTEIFSHALIYEFEWTSSYVILHLSKTKVCCQEEEYKIKNGVQHLERKTEEIAILSKSQPQV